MWYLTLQASNILIQRSAAGCSGKKISVYSSWVHRGDMLWRYSLDANGNAYFHSPQLMPHHRFSSTARVDSPEPLISFLLPGWKKCRNRDLQLQLPPTFCSGVEQVGERSNLSITHIQIFAKPLNIKHPIHTLLNCVAHLNSQCQYCIFAQESWIKPFHNKISYCTKVGTIHLSNASAL